MSSSSESHGTHDLNSPAMTLSEERLREMLAGLEGVTPGPWVKETEQDEEEDLPAFYVSSTVTTSCNLTVVARMGEASAAARTDAAHIARCDPDTMREILTLALLSLRSDAHTRGEVKVKPIEWEQGEGNYDGQEVWSAGDPWLFWIVKNPSSPDYVWCETLHLEGFVPASPVRGSYPSLEAAKAAAQADFETRIRSALSLGHPIQGEAVAWLKEWTTDDGGACSRVDVRAECEPWLAFLKPKLTPLFASQPPAPAGVREITEELRHAFRNADESDWRHLFAVVPDTGRGRFWKAVFTEVRAALAAAKGAGE
jgi:hypothetical protein